jgi:hypothetical protein
MVINMRKRNLLSFLAVFGLVFSISSCKKEDTSSSEILKQLSFKYDNSTYEASFNGVKSDYVDTFLNVEIPEKIKRNGIEYNVTSINKQAFANNTKVQSVKIPNSVISIEEEAFFKCSELRNIEFGNNVQSIGAYAFSQCKALVNVTLPESLKALPLGIFYQCTNLYSIELPQSITSISEKAFYGDNQLVYFTAKKINKIGEKAFEGCTSFKYVYYTDDEFSLEPDGDNNKYYDSAEVKFNTDISKNNLLNKYYFAFSPINNTCDISGLKDSSIKEINDLPEKITYLGKEFVLDGIYKNAFTNTKLESITLPETITFIGNYAFSNTSIKTLDLSNVLTISQYAFSNCTKLENITLCDQMSTLMNYAFENCTSLKNVVLPKNLISIKKGLFAGCTNLECVTIKENVKNIDGDVFKDCNKLTKINYTKDQESWNSIIKDNTVIEKIANVEFNYNYELNK